jgi:hypothetical protein
VGVGPAVREGIKLREETLENSIQISAYFSIRETESSVAKMFVDLVSDRILLRIMRAAIDFNDERLLRTKEIRDAIANHVLPSELVAI